MFFWEEYILITIPTVCAVDAQEQEEFWIKSISSDNGAEDHTCSGKAWVG